MKKRYLLVIPVLLFALHGGRLLVDAGQFRKIAPHDFGRCRLAARIAGAEDMEWSPYLKRIVISSDFRPNAGETNPPSGALYALAPGPKGEAVRVSPDLPFPFHPHGIALWEGEKGPRLFAVNHRPGESTIEVFDWDGKSFQFARTIRSPLLVAPNDLVAIGPEELFVSHDHASEAPLEQAVENYTRWGRGYVTHYVGGHLELALDGVFFANGLAFDPARKLLYVAATLEKRVRVYDANGPLRPLHSIPLSAGPDNVKLGTDGTLWIAAHPKILALKAHAENHAKLAPTLVIRVPHAAEAGAPPAEVMEDDGRYISAASVAMPLGKSLYLGAVFEDKVLECPLP